MLVRGKSSCDRGGINLADLRIANLADILVNYSIGVKPGEWVFVMSHVIAEPMVAEVVGSILRAGGNPTWQMDSDLIDETHLKNASGDQLRWVSPSLIRVAEKVDAIILILASSNTRYLTNVDPQKQQYKALAMYEMNKV